MPDAGSLFEQLSRLEEFIVILIGLIAISWGVVLCFWGHRVFKIILGFTGFIIGAFLAGLLAYGWTDGNAAVVLLAAVLGGAIVAFFYVIFYFVGVFFFGAMVFVFLGMHVSMMIGVRIHPLFLVLPAIACGVVAIIYRRFLIIISTALNGAEAIVFVLFFFVIGGSPPEMFVKAGMPLSMMLIFLLSWAVVASAGIIVQFEVTAKRRDELDGKKPPKAAKKKLKKPRPHKSKKN